MFSMTAYAVKSVPAAKLCNDPRPDDHFRPQLVLGVLLQAKQPPIVDGKRKVADYYAFQQEGIGIVIVSVIAPAAAHRTRRSAPSPRYEESMQSS
jgi:hypothetical protein